MLRPARGIDVVDVGAGKRVLQWLAHLLDQRFALATLLCDFLRQRAIFFSLEVLEREVLELPSHFRHTEAMRERSVEIPGLLRDAPPLFLGEEIERAHVM